MSMVGRAFEQPDGTVRIVYPNPKHRLEGETDAEFLDRMCPVVAAKAGVECGGSCCDVMPGSVPDGRRNQWRIKAGNLVIDPTVAPVPTLRERLDKANSVAELKGIMKEIIG